MMTPNENDATKQSAALPPAKDCPPAPIELLDSERTRCEVWSRVMGYHRPVDQWNPGKQQEHADRFHFKEPCLCS